ncbi:MAG: hypothetical protein A2493_02625 [Candidatus Magasanikbacteria bacterium RIFOXYC12_FULL_33_11]|uniref:Phosphoribosylanthranilate isomerase n=1 Tax=Candidatus Magasanikbacteria bacterium RIFOXYC12_FULL_33_11 TaxID=1798701 RepID=A0A1F6NRR9_9BACT|nr:MAG: hypothetical protein A2493_02625 [Candidatus Magasanikbacteria bacterium RIFOXYC12_FULL_33_11]
MFQVFEDHRPQGSNRVLHVGVMMSYKTLHDIPSRWNNVFPPKDQIAEIFSSDKVYNCLHYADYDTHPDLWKSLATAIFYGGIAINAIQLDMIWPDPREIEKGVRASRKPIEVILQIGKNALEEVDNDPQKVVDRLSSYKGVIHRVLLDKSMGRGLGMNATSLIPYARAIRDSFPMLGIGAAGGLGPETTQLVEPLVNLFPDLSIDAQGQLRHSGNALDPIDWSMAGNYLVKAHQLFA